MNWIAELCDLYDKNQHLAGRMWEDHIVLLPPYHTTVSYTHLDVYKRQDIS